MPPPSSSAQSPDPAVLAGGAAPQAGVDRPLCVDLDGTLLAGDVLYESVVRYLRPNLFRFVYVVLWLLRGRAHLKAMLAQRVSFNPASLPWRPEVLDMLRQEKARGRRLFLVTASHGETARSLTAQLNVFDDVFGTEPGRNLKGAAKADYLCNMFGEKGFDYVGDSRADFAVWARSAGGMVVGSRSRVAAAQRVNSQVTELVTPRVSRMSATFRMLRVHQWSKNVIIFVPLIASHHLTELGELYMTLLAFGCFCATASATYVLNDLLDLENDRTHHHKRSRPLASGVLSIPFGIATSAFLALVAAGFASFLPSAFLLTLLLYLALTLNYSLFLKRIVLADAIVLACLYTIRMVAGHTATGVPYSVWLLAFAVFIFFSLAVAKRYAELRNLSLRSVDPLHAAPGRDYVLDDMPTLLSLGTASGLIAALVMVLYVQSDMGGRHYSQPLFLLLLVPAYLYWIGRVWILAQRGLLNEDPVLFAITDRVSYVVALFAIVVMLVAIYY
ncbi:UbiA family prenyltransferase [Verrucomicrobia bacterium LW23]|nr:UbiA family prenyltransferase [Verrucomicrobia bacterium LW23]